MFKPRTSLTHPLDIAALRAGPAFGRIGVTFCPGKHDRAAATGAWARDLALDLDAIRSWGACCVVTLVEPAELIALKVENLGEEILARDMDWRHLPIPDYGVPDALFEWRWRGHGRELRQLLRRGENLVVHCKGGLGRAGLIAARLLAELGVEPQQAIKLTRAARKGAIETPSQLALARKTAPIEDVDQLDDSALEKISASLGSHAGGVFRTRGGEKFYIKMLETADLAQNERLAAKFYQLAGAPTLTYVSTQDRTKIATQWVDLAKKRLGAFDETELAQARHWFAVHAWTANWDALGLLGDNQGAVDGVAITLDLGGALKFRAQGDPKGAAFGDSVEEFERMRRDDDNFWAKKLFGSMSAAELAASVAEVAKIPDAAVFRAALGHGGDAALAEKMIRRKADLVRRLGGASGAKLSRKT